MKEQHNKKNDLDKKEGPQKKELLFDDTEHTLEKLYEFIMNDDTSDKNQHIKVSSSNKNY